MRVEPCRPSNALRPADLPLISVEAPAADARGNHDSHSCINGGRGIDKKKLHARVSGAMTSQTTRSPYSPQMHAKLLLAAQLLQRSKACFQMLKYDLIKSMTQANDIFKSMSVPLVKLVGLKVQELAAEGRQTFVSSCPTSGINLSPSRRSRELSSSTSLYWLQDGSVKSQVERHVADFVALQKQQTQQLVGLVKTVEKLLKSAEEAITNRFQDGKGYLESIQQANLVHLKKLHHEVVNLRAKDSRASYRVRVAEQGYQALMCLALKLQEYGLDKIKKELCDVKTEVEEIMNEFAGDICKAIIALLKEQKMHNVSLTVLKKFQCLVDDMESKVSEAFRMMSTESDKINSHAKSVELELKAQKVEKDAIFHERKFLQEVLKEKIGHIETLQRAVEKEIAEKHELKTSLGIERARALATAEALKQNETKFSDVCKLLQVTNGRLRDEHMQIVEACEKTKELYDQLSRIRHGATQGQMLSMGVDTQLEKGQGQSNPPTPQTFSTLDSQTVRPQFTQDICRHDRYCPKSSQIFTNLVKEVVSASQSNEFLERAEIQYLAPDYDTCNAVSWIRQLMDIQDFRKNVFEHKSKVVSFLTKPFHAGNATFCQKERWNTFPMDFTGYSEMIQLCYQKLTELVSELDSEIRVCESNNAQGSFTSLVLAVALKMVFQEKVVHRVSGSECSRQQPDERRNVIQAEHADGNLLMYSDSRKFIDGLSGTKRDLSSVSLHYDHEQDIGAKRLHTSDSASDAELHADTYAVEDQMKFNDQMGESKESIVCESRLVSRVDVKAGVSSQSASDLANGNSVEYDQGISEFCGECDSVSVVTVVERCDVNDSGPNNPLCREEIWQLLELGNMED